MPTLTDIELSKIIDAGDLGLITIDTNIFHRFGYDLTSPSLTALGQFAKSPIAFVLPDIIEGEVRNRMSGNSISATAQLRSALRDFRKARRPSAKVLADVEALLGVGDDINADVQGRWTAFVDATNAEMLTAGEYLNSDALVASYFGTKPPFEANEEKKAEFPDAIALLELEARGERDQKYVLAVSKDKGWSAFANDAKWLIIRDELPVALGFFHRADGYVVGRAVTMLEDAEKFALADDFDREVVKFVDNINPLIEADSFLFFDADFVSAEYEGRDAVQEHDVTIIDSDKDSVTLAFDAILKVNITAEFSFSIHDSIDDDYLTLGTTEVSRVVEVESHVVMKVARESGPEDGAISLEIETPRFVRVDFGEVEPDMQPDED